jgi:PPM family protein phosphatase
MTLALHYALRSDVGLLREGNEDSAYAGPRLLAIADGMGGHAAGEVASAVAISAIAPLDRRGLTDSHEMLDALAGAVASARSTLHDMSLADPATEGMGTTLTAMLWAGADVAICHIGDSRAYLLRDGDLYQITRDHTLIQSLVDEGKLSPAAAASHPQRSLIMRALQGSTDADPDLSMHKALLGDRYLLCSDGLTDVVTDEAVHKTLVSVPDAERAVHQLINQAIGNGGPDNITCIIADVVDTVSGPEPPSRQYVVAGAAANPDARALFSAAPAGMPAQDAGVQASVNGHHARTTVDDEDDDHPRRRWPIVTTAVGVLVLLVAGGLFWGWRTIQSQYYLGSDGKHVVIYRGISDQIAGLHLSSVYKRTSIPAAFIPFAPDTLQLPTTPASLAKTQQTVSTLESQLTRTCTNDQANLAKWVNANNAHNLAVSKARKEWLKSKSKSKTKFDPNTVTPLAPAIKEPTVPGYCLAQGAG